MSLQHAIEQVNETIDKYKAGIKLAKSLPDLSQLDFPVDIRIYENVVSIHIPYNVECAVVLRKYLGRGYRLEGKWSTIQHDEYSGSTIHRWADFLPPGAAYKDFTDGPIVRISLDPKMDKSMCTVRATGKVKETPIMEVVSL